jgi:predicted GNAT superfamily acetyltransferase
MEKKIIYEEDRLFFYITDAFFGNRIGSKDREQLGCEIAQRFSRIHHKWFLTKNRLRIFWSLYVPAISPFY